MSDDGSESSPMFIPPPAPTEPPDTLPHAGPAPEPDVHYATADQVLRLTNMVSECLLAIATLKPAIVAEVKSELNAATAILSAEIEAAREELREHVSATAADLDRRAEKRADKTDGKVDALAKVVSDHRLVVEEISARAYSLARQIAQDSPPSLSVVEAET